VKNVLIGTHAGAFSNGDNNVMIGNFAGEQNTGSNNVYIVEQPDYIMKKGMTMSTWVKAADCLTKQEAIMCLSENTADITAVNQAEVYFWATMPGFLK
jgi:hypothetical protein